MSYSIRSGIAISTAALAFTIAGCAGPQSRVGSASSFGGKADGEIGLAMRALAALNANNLPLAIDLAERTVARTPNDAGFRALLGSAYFASGRFASAEAAFKDSLSIYSNQPQVVLKLALVEIARGKTGEAVALLEAARSVLDPADYGLALALAGRSGDAAAVLLDAARQPGADARVRQNLALAYALSGDWTQARTVAAQDLAANQVDARIQQWMKFAKPARASDQVAALTGVAPVAVDPGQPVRLALRGGNSFMAVAALQPQPLPQPRPQPQPVAMPAPLPEFAAPAPLYGVAQPVSPAPPPPNLARIADVVDSVAIAEVEPALVEVAAAAFAPPPPPVPLPVALVAAARYAPPPLPVTRPVFTRAAAQQRKAAKLQRATASMRPALLRRGGSTSVVQLGAYRSAQRVLVAWNAAARRYSSLRAYAPMSARFASTRGLVYRLSVRGFANHGEAAALCARLRRSGGSCFVRTFANDAPVLIASR